MKSETGNSRIAKVGDVDSYIAHSHKRARAKLIQLRRIVRSAVPEAEEVISYNMPYYKYRGTLGGFAAFKDHIGFFGALASQERAEFRAFEIGKGTIRFPLDKPLPAASITKMIRARKKRKDSRARHKETKTLRQL